MTITIHVRSAVAFVGFALTVLFLGYPEMTNSAVTLPVAERAGASLLFGLGVLYEWDLKALKRMGLWPRPYSGARKVRSRT